MSALCAARGAAAPLQARALPTRAMSQQVPALEFADELGRQLDGARSP
jgi:hypothetical protein